MRHRAAQAADTLGLTPMAFELLDAQPALVASNRTPVPYAASLEEATLPGVSRIAAGIRAVAAA